MKCEHDTTSFRYLGSAHVLSTLISTFQLQHHIPPVSILPWRGTGKGQGKILSLLAVFLWTRLFGLQGLADVHQIPSFGKLLQMHQSLRGLWSPAVVFHCLPDINYSRACVSGTLPRNWKAEKLTSYVYIDKTQSSMNKGFMGNLFEILMAYQSLSLSLISEYGRRYGRPLGSPQGWSPGVHGRLRKKTHRDGYVLIFTEDAL